MIVVKIGGSVICKNAEFVIANLSNYVDKSIVIHGGGCFVNEVMKRMGIEPKYLRHPNGLVSRYTDSETLTAFVMAMMWINKSLTSSLYSRGIPALGLSGADLGIIKAKRKERVLIVDERGRQRIVDGGYAGKIVEIKTELLSPPPLKIVAPIAVSERGELLNIDGDQLALDIALRTKAEKLVMLSDVDGVYLGGEVVKLLTSNEAEELAREEEVRGGMKRKLLMAAEAARGGVEVIIGNGLVERPIDRALNGVGTRILP